MEPAYDVHQPAVPGWPLNSVASASRITSHLPLDKAVQNRMLHVRALQTVVRHLVFGM